MNAINFIKNKLDIFETIIKKNKYIKGFIDIVKNVKNFNATQELIFLSGEFSNIISNIPRSTSLYVV